MSEFYVLLTATITGTLGLIQVLVDKRNTRVRDLKVNHLKKLKFKLEKFYYPIFFLLQRDKYIGDNIFSDPEKISSDHNEALDKINLENHTKIMFIIEENIAETNPKNDILSEIVKYDKHTSIYKHIRTLGIKDKYPSDYGAPYPPMFLLTIEKRINQIRLEIETIEYDIGSCLPKLKLCNNSSMHDIV